ncbi:MAG: SHD1 domain-containing protein [Rubripirellula sp.]
MRNLFAVVIALLTTISCCEVSVACGGSGQSSQASSSSFRGGNASGITSRYPTTSPIAMQAARANMARQATLAQTRAYNAQMMPTRIANANKVRAEKAALRESRAQTRIAKMESRQREQQQFLAKARTWTDRSGKFEIVAILADATDRHVKLTKQDGTHISVPINRLCSDDRSYVDAEMHEQRIMLASL